MSVKVIQSLNGEWGILAAYKAIRIHYRQPFNLYLWDNMDPPIGSFDNPVILQYAEAFSLLARWALQNPDDAGAIQDRSTMDMFTAAAKTR